MGNLSCCIKNDPQQVVLEYMPEDQRNELYNSHIYCGQTQIAVYGSNLLSEDVDIIVNVQNINLNLTTYLSHKITQCGGESVVKQIEEFKNKQGELKIGNVFYTHAGDLLNCDYIMHCSLPSFVQDIAEESEIINKIVTECLALANTQLNLSSIAFPLLHNGEMGISILQTAAVMFQAIKNFIKNEGENNKLKHIYVISSQQRVLMQSQKAIFSIFSTNNINNNNEQNQGSQIQKNEVCKDQFTLTQMSTIDYTEHYNSEIFKRPKDLKKVSNQQENRNQSNNYQDSF